MAGSYASRLKKGVDYGVCGLPEVFDPTYMVQKKVSQLARMIKDSKHVVLFTGAGISTSVGIPDFRGPRGVWTKELQQQGAVPFSFPDDSESDSVSEESYTDTPRSKRRRSLVSSFPAVRVAISKRRRRNIAKGQALATPTAAATGGSEYSLPTSTTQPPEPVLQPDLKPVLTQIDSEAPPVATASCATPPLPARSPEASNDFEQAVPSLTHMAIVGLVNASVVQYVISQNVDGLHLRSGLSPTILSELHGNVFKEVCSSCKRVFFRDWDVQGIGLRPTGRKCEACNGALHDSLLDCKSSSGPAAVSPVLICAVGDDALPERDLEDAQKHCKKADLTLCLGTSLRVAPANGLPLLSRRMVICNLQATAKDRYASLIINAPCDTIMDLLMRHLTLDIPVYRRTESLLLNAVILPSDPARYVVSITRPSARDPLHCPFIEHVDVTRDATGPFGSATLSVASPAPLSFSFELSDQPMIHNLRIRLRARPEPIAIRFTVERALLPTKQCVEIETVTMNYNNRDLPDVASSLEGHEWDSRRTLPRKAKISHTKKAKKSS